MLYILYAKRKLSDPIYDFHGTAETWEDCAERLELLGRDHDAVSYLEINNGDLSSQRWEYDRTQNEGR